MIRTALDQAEIAVLLLTPSYYESRFCLAEAGAVWVQKKRHIPLLVPPINYHDLEGVQLGEQAAKIDSPTDLDAMRDEIHQVVGDAIPTGAWNEQKTNFLNVWTAEFDGKIAAAKAVPFPDYEGLRKQLEHAERTNADLVSSNERFRDFARKLETQNETLRLSSAEAPPPPILEQDEHTHFLSEAERAIELAANKMDVLPPIAAEALFQFFHSGDPLTVGGTSDRFEIDVAKKCEEDGYLSLVEDQAQAVTPRHEHPAVEEAESALTQVREIVFDGLPYNARAVAGDWAKPLLKEKYEIADPTFELRPVWEALGFL